MCSNNINLGGSCLANNYFTPEDWDWNNSVPITEKDPHTLQARKDEWMRACFDDEITDSVDERNRRFLEEALELVQAAKMTRDEAHFMVDYVFDRPVGDLYQEVGGAILTLAALCNVQHINMLEAGEHELDRVWTKVERIREKQKMKPVYTPKKKFWRFFRLSL